jgi:hypothetical protein
MRGFFFYLPVINAGETKIPKTLPKAALNKAVHNI